MSAQSRFAQYVEEKRAMGLDGGQILEALKSEIVEFQVQPSDCERAAHATPDHRESLAAIDELLDASVNAVSHARRAISQATESCAHIEQGSQTAGHSSEAIRASIGAIALQTKSAAQVIYQITGNVDLALANSDTLATAVQKISSVVLFIRKIASQTNLLALNATIEAARVGTVGRGFAVVANEVKTLANQTAAATEDIASQVAQIQAASQVAHKSVKSITTDIRGTSDTLRSIADAVTSQEFSATEVVSALEACTGGLQKLRVALGNIENGATASNQRLEKIHSLVRDINAWTYPREPAAPALQAASGHASGEQPRKRTSPE